jgi:tRNA G18 (ribose-2'-O)-methylase SpoU
MDGFPFTKKKFLSLSLENQNKRMVEWLTGFYQKLTTNRMGPASLALFTRQYNEILAWTGMEHFIRPDTGSTREWMECISGRIHLHRSAMGRVLRDHDLLEPVRTGDAGRSPVSSDINCHMALDGIRSLYNVGSIFRICEAAGFSSIILGHTLGKDHPGVQKTAMGAEKWVGQEMVTDLAGCLLQKKEAGFRIIGIETMGNARAFHEFSWQENTILVFGNEEYGISSHVMAVCDDFVHIPVFGKKNSINIAAAAAVICFQVAVSLNPSVSMTSPG